MTVAAKTRRARPSFDVFLAYNSKDKHLVRLIADRLKAVGLRPWFDEEQIRPGQPFQDAIQKSLPRCRNAALVLGAEGLGRWQVAELRLLVAQFVERGIPVIPILLPGLDQIPDELSFLRQYRYVSFAGTEDEQAYRLLYWGITGQPAAIA